MKKAIIFLIGILLLLFLFSVKPIFAADKYQDGVIGGDEIILDDIFLNATNIEVSGTINGILFAIGKNISIKSGAILENDVFLVGQSISIQNGALINGNVTILGQKVEIDTIFDRNIYAAGSTFMLGPNSKVLNNLFYAGFQLESDSKSVIENNIYTASYQSLLNGKINKNLRIATASLELNGIVLGDANIMLNLWQIDEDSIRFWMPYLQSLGIPEPMEIGFRLSENTEIGGRLVYSSNDVLEEAFDINPTGGIIILTPTTTDKRPDSVENPSQVKANSWQNRLIRILRLTISLVICGLLTLWISPGLLTASIIPVEQKPLNAFGIGIITIITIYIGLFVLTAFFILAAFLFGLFSLGSLGSSVFGLGLLSIGWVFLFFNFIVKFVSKLVVAFWIGKKLIPYFKKNEVKHQFTTLILGIVVFVLLRAIPFYGWIISVIVTLVGLGALWYVAQSQNKYPFIKWKA